MKETNLQTVSEEAREILEDQLATLAVIIEENLEGIDAFKIDWKSDSKEFFDNDQEKFGLVMIHYHRFNDLKVDYDPYAEFELFPTLNHAYTYVVDKVLKREGYDPRTLKKL